MLTLEQLMEWAAFYELEPAGFEVDEARHGQIGWAILRSFGGWEGKPSDFTVRKKPAESGAQKLMRMLGFGGPRSP